MEITTWLQTLINLTISLGYGIIALVLSVVTLYFIDHYLYKDINFLEEIKKGNIAASIVYSVVLLFVALIVTTAIN